MEGRTDWGPIIGSTDSTGRWSMTGQFEKSDFGGWEEVWTVGGKLASPAVQFSVNAPCLPDGQGSVAASGRLMVTCETAEGRQVFRPHPTQTPFELQMADWSLGAQRADTGRVPNENPPGVTAWTATIHIWLRTSRGGRGDETADLIAAYRR